jgi:hypothetical protein
MDHLTPLGSGLPGMLVRISRPCDRSSLRVYGGCTDVTAAARCTDASEQVSCRMKKEISGLHEALTLLEHAAAATRPETTAAPLDLQGSTEDPHLASDNDALTAAPLPSGSTGGPHAASVNEEDSEVERAAAKEARLHMDSSFPAVPCKTGASGLLFLRFRAAESTEEHRDHDPVELFRSVLAALEAQRSPPPVYLQRMFPVQTTCEPLLGNIISTLRTLLVDIAADPARASMLGPSSTYSVMYKSRGNSSLDRNALYGAIGGLMAEQSHHCGGGVSLAKPTWVVMCQMIPTAHGAGGGTAVLTENTVCGLSIFPADKLTEIQGGSVNVKNLSGGSMEQQRQERLKRQQKYKQPEKGKKHGSKECQDAVAT